MAYRASSAKAINQAVVRENSENTADDANVPESRFRV